MNASALKIKEVGVGNLHDLKYVRIEYIPKQKCTQRPSMVSSIVPDPGEASPPPQPASSGAFSA